MAKQSTLDFFEACATDPAVMAHYQPLSASELILHARSAGYEFTLEDLAGVIGAMEVHVIMERAGEEINASSSLWVKMWGKPRLQYVVDELYRTFSPEELRQLLDQ
jgi:hypothetical protein